MTGAGAAGQGPRIIAYPDREAWARGAAAAVAADVAQALAAHGRASLAVPGGTTPAPMFEALSQAPLDWRRVTVLPGDERRVAETSPRSNARLIREYLLRNRAGEAGFFPLTVSESASEGEIDRLCALLMPHLPINVLLLGMGEDRHVASLFPGDPGLAAALCPDAPPVLPVRSPQGEGRLSLTAPVLRMAGSVHLLIAGAAKRAALEAAAGMDEIAAPVRIVSDRATVHWVE